MHLVYTRDIPTAPRSYFVVRYLSDLRVLSSFPIYARCTSFYLCVATSCDDENTAMQCLQRFKVWMIQQKEWRATSEGIFAKRERHDV